MTTNTAIVLNPMVRRDEVLWNSSLSYSGGLPTRGPQPWPGQDGPDSAVIHFLCQLECAALKAAAPGLPCPGHGVLQFFADTTTFVNWKETFAAHVVWQDSAAPGDLIQPPDTLETIGGAHRYRDLFKQATSAEDAPRSLPRWPLTLRSIRTTAETIMTDVAALDEETRVYKPRRAQDDPGAIADVPLEAVEMARRLLVRCIQENESKSSRGWPEKIGLWKIRRIAQSWHTYLSRNDRGASIGPVFARKFEKDLHTIQAFAGQGDTRGHAFADGFRLSENAGVRRHLIWLEAMQLMYEGWMTADRALYDRIPEEIRARFHENVWEKPLDPHSIGPWCFWDQAFGPTRAGSRAQNLPDPETHELLLRLSADPKRGFLWDKQHTPILTFWIARADLHEGRWDTAFARLSDV